MIDPALPGADIVIRGLSDLSNGRETIDALLVSIASERLRELSVPVPETTIPDPARKLYARLDAAFGDGAHSKYNALRRRLVSFMRAASCANR